MLILVQLAVKVVQVLEVCMVLVSLRGSVADDRPRQSMHWLLYIKQGPSTTTTNLKFDLETKIIQRRATNFAPLFLEEIKVVQL